MFEASWEETSTETVAERRQRKVQESVTRDNLKTPSLTSSRSSRSSLIASGVAILERLSNGRRKYSKEHARPSTEPKAGRQVSEAKTRSSYAQERHVPIKIVEHVYDYNPPRRSQSPMTPVTSPRVSNDESIFSRPDRYASTISSTGYSIADYAAKTNEVQELCPGSFVTRSTEVNISPTDAIHPIHRHTNEVKISAAKSVPEDFLISLEAFAFPSIPSPPSGFPLHAASLDTGRSNRGRNEHQNQDMKTGKSRRMPESGVIQASRYDGVRQSAKSTSWTAPRDWDCMQAEATPETAAMVATEPHSPTSIYSEVARPFSSMSEKVASEPPTTHLQRHIRKMLSATPKIILERLAEEWVGIDDDEILKDLDFDQQIWLLVGLRWLAGIADPDDDLERGDLVAVACPGRLLSFHESTACASYLATASMDSEVHHISTTADSAAYLPNLQTLSNSNIATTVPYPTSLFAQIHSMTLPLMLPSHALPALLQELNRILTPSGRLNLTILDPFPVSTTLGPLLQAWISQNLIPNLDKSFRYTIPSRLISNILPDASFAPIQSKKVHFCALADGERRVAANDSSAQNEDNDEMARLNALIGRMLWREIYGLWVDDVQVTGWWWENDGIVDECAAWGTTWICELMIVGKAD